jgi:predicted Fe-Mo cluster-binding NifX family protein
MMKKVKKALNDGQSLNMVKVLIPLLGDDVAPRFDLAPEALIAVFRPNRGLIEERTIILPEASAEALCHLILTEKVDMVVCCAIEEEYYQYLVWKKLKIIDSVMGPYIRVLDRVMTGEINSGDNLLDLKAPRSAKK